MATIGMTLGREATIRMTQGRGATIRMTQGTSRRGTTNPRPPGSSVEELAEPALALLLVIGLLVVLLRWGRLVLLLRWWRLLEGALDDLVELASIKPHASRAAQ